MWGFQRDQTGENDKMGFSVIRVMALAGVMLGGREGWQTGAGLKTVAGVTGSRVQS